MFCYRMNTLSVDLAMTIELVLCIGRVKCRQRNLCGWVSYIPFLPLAACLEYLGTNIAYYLHIPGLSDKRCNCPSYVL